MYFRYTIPRVHLVYLSYVVQSCFYLDKFAFCCTFLSASLHPPVITSLWQKKTCWHFFPAAEVSAFICLNHMHCTFLFAEYFSRIWSPGPGRFSYMESTIPLPADFHHLYWAEPRVWSYCWATEVMYPPYPEFLFFIYLASITGLTGFSLN